MLLAARAAENPVHQGQAAGVLVTAGGDNLHGNTARSGPAGYQVAVVVHGAAGFVFCYDGTSGKQAAGQPEGKAVEKPRQEGLAAGEALLGWKAERLAENDSVQTGYADGSAFSADNPLEVGVAVGHVQGHSCAAGQAEGVHGLPQRRRLAVDPIGELCVHMLLTRDRQVIRVG